MPVYELIKELVFPNPAEALDDGLLAIGGDLSPERIYLAYSNGIFPWYNSDSPILWWSPDPRCVLFPDDFKVSKSLKQTLRSAKYEVKINQNFAKTVDSCATVSRNGVEEAGTWITSEMREMYIEMNRLGFAHSVESYLNGKLVGGLFGISFHDYFCGESMFFIERDASKVALHFLVEKIKQSKFKFIDAQTTTSHLLSLGAREIPRENYLDLLSESKRIKTNIDWWK